MSRLLATLVARIAAAPVLSLIVIAFVTFAAGVFAVTHFRVNADQASLIAPDSEFQNRFDAFRDAFPTYKRTTLVVVESASAAGAANGAEDLAVALEARSDLFRSVFTTATMPFFRENGLLYLSEDDLARQLDALVAAQPGIAIVANERGLSGVLTLLRQGASQGNAERPELRALATEIARAADAIASDDKSVRLSLGALEGTSAQTSVQLISVQINEDNTDFLSPRAKLDVIRDLAVELGLTTENGYRVRLTGNIPLSVDELSQVRESLGLAGTLSLIMLAIVLGVGVRSARIVSVMVITLLVGGIWSMAWAMLSIGEVNLLSASFAVLFVGLGIDFAIHYALRTQEGVERGEATRPALAAAASHVGPAIALGALTSAIGFLAFLPTDYKGFADLGVIAGGGMGLALIAALTVIPACLSALGMPHQRNAGGSFATATGALFRASQDHALPIVAAAAIVGIAAALITTQARFDFSTLALKNDQSEPIRTLADLQERGLVTDYAAYVVAPGLEDTPQVVATLEELPTVGQVQTAENLIPQGQEDKLLLIEDTAFLFFQLAGRLGAPPAPVPDNLTFADTVTTTGEELADYEELDQALARLTPAQLEALNDLLANQLSRDLQRLLDSFNASEVSTLDQIPQQLRDRFLGSNGEALVIGLPKGDVTRTEDLRAFVADVKSVYPDSTGRAVVEATVGNVVVGAFTMAVVLALVAVSLVVLIATRSLIDTAFVLMPLLLAALATAATGVLIGMPFNQANIIVLPLIMGLGVDNGIHMLMRYRKDGSLDRMLASSTPRAIVLSTLTTIGAFGALSVSVHAGTASMGILLTVAMLFLLISTVIVLPALLKLRSQGVAG